MRDELIKRIRNEIKGWIFDAIINKRHGTPLATWMEATGEDIDKRVAQWIEHLLKEKKFDPPAK